MIRKGWQWIIFSIVSLTSLVALFCSLTLKSKANLEERIQKQVELFREEIVKAATSEDSYTLRRFSESFRGIKNDDVQFVFQNNLGIKTIGNDSSCGIHIEIPVTHMGIFLGKFLFCRSWTGTVISTSSDPWFLSMSFALMALIIFSTVVPLAIYRRTIRKILNTLEDSNYETPVSEQGMDQIQIKVLNVIRDHVKSKIELERQSLVLEKNKSLVMFASQVSHDIRSPLSALNMILGQLSSLPEDRRIIVRNAVQRINDIANTMLDRTKADSVQNSNGEKSEQSSGDNKSAKLKIEFLPALIDVLVSEKRVQYREYGELEIEVDLKNSFGTFAKINGTELKRVISNLVNNSVESLSNQKGRVIVGVKKVDSDGEPRAEIFIKDNGKGIPKHILNRLGQRGISEGKDGTNSGSGLGVYHAKLTIESFGGKMEISSTERQGTEIKIILPLTDAPNWFAKTVDLTNKKYLVSLDDDTSIHQIWAGRIQSLNINHLEHIKFQSGEAFEKYVTTNIGKLRQTLFLINFELLNQQKTGLDIIEELGLEKYSILITSRYEEPDIQARASRLRLHLLPKSLSGFVPITRKEIKKYDWVLLDDDDLVHMSWSVAAKEANKTFLGFKTPQELYAYKDQLDFSSNIYIDSSLGNGVKGEDVARNLFENNFRNIYLATGYSPDQFTNMPFVKEIVGKEPPASKND